MSAILSAKFKMIDEMSATLDQLGNKGNTILAGLEDSCVKFDTAMQSTSKSTAQAASSLAKLSGDTSSVLTASKQLAVAMNDEADKMRKSALNAQIKADLSERMAAEARNHYNELKKQNEAEEHATKAMKESEKAALEEAERLEKAAAAAKKKADSAEKAADAAYENAQAVMKSAQAEDRLNSSALKTAASEKKVADALNKSEHEAEQYSDSMRRAADESDKLGSRGANAGELLQDAFTALGIAAALREITDGFIACTNASIEFESAITGVYKTVDGTDEQLAKISDDIKGMALEIPSSTTEIAGVAETAGQLGIATEDVTDFTEVMINLGEATNLSSEEAASSLAKFSNITGMTADNYENLGSTVVALGNNFATTETDIVAMATRMASAGTLAGMTESDILGLSAAMSSVGIEAEAGGSAMSKLMTDMQVAVETGNDSLLDFASVAGMTSEQFADAFQNNAANALYSFIDGLNDVERNGETATVILENMGITEVRLSNAVKSLATNSEGLADAVDLAGEAWNENTALANEVEKRYSTLESRLTITKNAANNLKVAIGDVLTPAIGELADTGTNVLNWMTGFVEEHPKVTAGITAGAVALGVLAVGIGGFTLAVNIAKPAVEKLTIAMSACPLFLPLTIGAGITAGVIAFTKIIQANQDTVEDYNGTLEQCRTELDSTQRAYDNVCKMYGSNSDAAKQLAGELDTLNAQYEKGGGFIADYEQRLVESQEALDSFTSAYNDKMDSINKDWQGGLIATAQLEALSNQSQITNSDLDIMKNYADYLNDTFNCNIEVNYDTKELTGFNPESVTNQLTKLAEENRKQAAAESMTSAEFTNGYIDSLNEKQKIEQEYTIVRNEILKSMNDISAVNTTGYTLAEADEEFQKQIAEAESHIAEYENTARNAFSVMGTPETVDGFLNNLENMANGFNNVTESAKDTIDILNKEEAVSDVWSSNEQQITELANAYNDAYISIRADLDGMFGLFEEAKMNLEETLSLDSAISNLESQIDYLNQYEEAINKLSEMEINSNIIEQLNPEQAVAFAQELGNLESIDPAAAEAKINELNGAFDKLSEAKDKTAESMADVELEFSKKLNEMQKDMEKTIEDMELDVEAKEAAKVTMDSYISQLKSSGNNAVSEAQSIVSRISAALNSVSSPSVNVSTPAVAYGPQVNTMPSKTSSVTTAPATGSSYSTSLKIPGHADGTLSAAPGLALVGEEGPELVRFSGGEQVYTADETMSVIMLNPELFPTFNAYARGTQSAAKGVALVGEEGPELVVMNGGEKVFTASETEKIFNNNIYEKSIPVQNNSGSLSMFNYDSAATESILNNYAGNNLSTAYSFSTLNYDNSVVRNKSAETNNHIEKSLPAHNAIDSYSMINYDNSISNEYAETETILNNSLPVHNNSETFSAFGYNNSAEYINNFENTESVLTAKTPYAESSSIFVMPEETFTEERTEKSESQSKDINLNINGSGTISVKGDMSKEQVVSILTDYLKPVLMNIVEQECFEEGESHYEI